MSMKIDSNKNIFKVPVAFNILHTAMGLGIFKSPVKSIERNKPQMEDKKDISTSEMTKTFTLFDAHRHGVIDNSGRHSITSP